MGDVLDLPDAEATYLVNLKRAEKYQINGNHQSQPSVVETLGVTHQNDGPILSTPESGMVLRKRGRPKKNGN